MHTSNRFKLFISLISNPSFIARTFTLAILFTPIFIFSFILIPLAINILNYTILSSLHHTHSLPLRIFKDFHSKLPDSQGIQYFRYIYKLSRKIELLHCIFAFLSKSFPQEHSFPHWSENTYDSFLTKIFNQIIQWISFWYKLSF